MFTYYLKSALRSVLSRKLYSFVSVFGMAVGMTVAILIFSFVRYEASFDTMHPYSENTYRLNWISGDGSHFATFFNPISPILATALPEIENFTRLAPSSELVTVGNVSQYRTLTMVDNDFFKLFDYPEISGTADTAIRDTRNAVITEAAAMEIFGRSDAVGEVFTVNGAHDFQVAAIVGSNHGNSHLVSNIFLNIENLTTVRNNPGFWENMGSDVMYHYIVVEDGMQPVQLHDNIMAFIEQNIMPGTNIDIAVQPLKDIHFTTDLQNEMSTRDDITGMVKPLRQRSDIFIFAGVAILTLGIASLNFMNLQVAQLSKRAREIGIRRIVGSSRLELARLFTTEAVMISVVAMLLSVLLCNMLLPYFNSMVSASAELSDMISIQSLLLLLGLAAALGLAASAYPVYTVARLAPTHALKGSVVKGVSTTRFRSGLIIIQFSISIGLIVASGIVSTQINYAMNKSLGFNPENVVTVELPNIAARNAYERMRDELLNEPGIVDISAASIIPTRDLSDGTEFVKLGGSRDDALAVRLVNVQDRYFDVLGMNFLAGRALTSDYPTDITQSWTQTVTTSSGGIVLNETAARTAGWENPQDAIGQQLYQEGQFRGNTYRNDATVTGVVEDAHFRSIRTDIESIAFVLMNNRNVMVIRLAEGNQSAALAAIDSVWQQNIPEFPIQRSYLADSYSAFYSSENNTFILFIGLTAIAILIACLGLYALATFVAERRRKEVCIRRVLGATVRRLAGLLAWDFSKLVILANIIAWPLAWWSMEQWLGNFAYRTDISIGIFLLAGIATFILALGTTFQRAYSVANANPAVVLRAE